MAKTRFTEIRLEAITRKLEFEMWCVLNQMSSNIKKFEAGERPARETRMRHRTFVELFLRHDRSKESCDALCKFYALCEFFEK